MGALPLIAIRVLDASTFQVSLLTAAAGLVGAAFALPRSPAREARRKRPVMIAADLVRALLFLSVPLAHAMDVLAFWHLVVVSGVAALGGVVFGGASAAHLKNLVPTEHRTEALGKLVSTFWLFNTGVSRRLGGHRTLVTSGLLRGLPLFALPFLPEGVAGLVIYVVATFLLLVAAGVFRPVYSALRMDATDDAHMMRVTTAFTLAARGAGPLFALLAGVLATWIGVRGALMVGGIGLLVSGLFLPRRDRSLDPTAPRTAPAR